MKKIILTSLIAGFVGFTANASDAGLYHEEEYTVDKTESVELRNVSYDDTEYAMQRPVQQVGRVARPVQTGRPCARRSGAPVRVNTHTEVINHYQMYQPVTIYEPAGNYAERQVIVQQKPCNRCAR